MSTLPPHQDVLVLYSQNEFAFWRARRPKIGRPVLILPLKGISNSSESKGFKNKFLHGPVDPELSKIQF